MYIYIYIHYIFIHKYLSSPATVTSTVACHSIWFNKHRKIVNKSICFQSFKQYLKFCWSTF